MIAFYHPNIKTFKSQIEYISLAVVYNKIWPSRGFFSGAGLATTLLRSGCCGGILKAGDS